MFEDFHELSKNGFVNNFNQYSAEDLKWITSNDVNFFIRSILTEKYIDLVLLKMQELNILEHIVPGINGVIQLKDPKNRFKDLWDHTVKVVAKSKPTVEIRTAALFHDFGKPATLKIENDKVTFHNHENLSVKYFMNFANKWRIFSKDEYVKIKFLIRQLGYIESYTSEWTDSAVRRFYQTIGDYIDDLIELSRADVTSANPNQHERVNNNLKDLKDRIINLKEKDNIIPPLPTGLGNALMNIGIFGPKISIVKSELEQDIKLGKIKAYQNIEYYINYLKNV